MNRKNIFKYSLNTLSALTGFAIVIFIALPTGSSFIDAVIKKPYIALGVAIILLAWIVMMLVISTILLLSENKRNEAFMITTNTEIRDELEEKASSDAIKKTFIFNLAFLAFIFSLSGMQIGEYTNKDGKREASFGYSLWDDEVDSVKKEMTEKIENLDAETKKNLESKGFNLDVKSTGLTSGRRLIPKKVFSPFGVLCLILLQLLTFKAFLTLNLRKLNTDGDDE